MNRWTPVAGSPQGAVISPLLSNIYLDPLDRLLAQHGYPMVRYADDFVILTRSHAEAQKALALVRGWVAENGLALHPTDPDIGHDDRGGNCVGILHGNAHTPIRLHGYWDTNLVVAALTKEPGEAADTLMSLLSPANREKWTGGDASTWASEAYEIAKAKVYAGVIDHAPAETGLIFRGFDGRPDEKCGPSKVYEITAAYDTTAKGVVKEQLAKAGLRLAGVLKESFP